MLEDFHPNREVIMVELKLETPFGEDREFEEIIKNKKSVVVFVRYPG
jgi:hypothetical protein